MSCAIHRYGGCGVQAAELGHARSASLQSLHYSASSLQSLNMPTASATITQRSSKDLKPAPPSQPSGTDVRLMHTRQHDCFQISVKADRLIVSRLASAFLADLKFASTAISTNEGQGLQGCQGGR